MTSSGRGGDRGAPWTDEDSPVPLVLCTPPAGPARAAAVRLLMLGHPEDEVGPWCEEGVVYALVDISAPAASEPMAATVVAHRMASSVELGPIASRGPAALELSRRLLDEVGYVLLRSDVVRIVAAAQPPSTDLLHRLGFRTAADPAWLVRDL